MTSRNLAENEDAARFEALGRFVHQFAQVETLLLMSVWHLSNVQMRVAKAMFSGIRAEGAMQYINRLLEVLDDTGQRKRVCQDIFAHLGQINEARNLILHYGMEADGNAHIATNRLIALTDSRVKQVPISTELLKNMTADLQKISAHLLLDFGDPEARSVLKRRLDALVQRPWLYTPPPQSSRASSSAPSAPAQRRQRKPSPK